MNSIDSLRLLVSKITYKPGWKFDLIIPDYSGVVQNHTLRYWDPLQLLITQKVKDINRPDTDIMLSFISAIEQEAAMQMSEKDFIRIFIGTAIRNFELHEMDEWFKIDGKCVFEPKH